MSEKKRVVFIIMGVTILLGMTFVELQTLFLGNPTVLAEEDPSSSTGASQDLLKDLASDLSSLKSPFTKQLPLPEVPKIENKIEPSGTVSPQPSDGGPSPVRVEAPLPNLMISGLVWNTNQPQAIVNDQIVNVGDKIQDWTITAISQEGIEVSLQGSTHFITNDFDHSTGGQPSKR